MPTLFIRWEGNTGGCDIASTHWTCEVRDARYAWNLRALTTQPVLALALRSESMSSTDVVALAPPRSSVLPLLDGSPALLANPFALTVTVAHYPTGVQPGKTPGWGPSQIANPPAIRRPRTDGEHRNHHLAANPEIVRSMAAPGQQGAHARWN
jgi:hypothetical protein